MKKLADWLMAGVITFGLADQLTTLAQEPPGPIPLIGTPPPPGAPAGKPSNGPSPAGMDGRRGGRPMMQEIKLVERFDKDDDQRLDGEERKAAREFLAKERAEGRLGRFPLGGPGRGPGGPRGIPGPEGADRPDAGPRAPAGADGSRPDAAGARGFPFGGRRNQPPAQPGRKVTPEEVKSYAAKPLYDAQTLRTLFFEFEDADWEKEMADFHNTDVEVPAKLSVDGKTYKDVGVHFRGMSSFMMVGEGYKRSLGVSLDFTNGKKDLKGYNTLDLLNAHGDPSFMRAVLYYQIARGYLPAPKANFVRVVINGESWGIYVNKEHFGKDFIQEWYGTKKGARWKVPGSPAGGGGLEYLGDDVQPYKGRYELKSKDDPKSWESLIKLCRVLNETPTDQLEEKLAPILDLDGALRFLALENALVNNDGYWVRASDYSMYEDESGQFHIIPHDANETFSFPGGPGFGGGGRGGPGGGRFAERRPDGAPGDPAVEANAAAAAPKPEVPASGGDVLRGGGAPGTERGPQTKGVELDPLISAKDAAKPLLSKLLAVPALRERYLGYVRDIAETWLDWEKLRPIAAEYAALIGEEVKLDTRKLESTEAFERSLDGAAEDDGASPRPRRGMSLKSFADQRRAYLLSYPAIRELDRHAASPSPSPEIAR